MRKSTCMQLQTFYVCETNGRETPCIFTERTMQPLWKRTGGDIARCIRHGNLISREIEAESKEALKAKWKVEDGRD